MFCWPCILVRRWVNDQLDVQLRYNNNNYYYYYYYYYYHYYYYNPLNVSSNSVLIIRRSNLINTTSGIVFCVSDSPLCRLRRNYTRCCINTGLFEITVGVLTTCHTQYTSDSSICIFLFNRTTLTVFVTYLTGALYVHPLWFYKHQHDNPVRSKLSVACQRWWFQWRFWFVPSVPGYLGEEEEYKPDPWHNSIERNHMGLHQENEVASC